MATGQRSCVLFVGAARPWHRLPRAVVVGLLVNHLAGSLLGCGRTREDQNPSAPAAGSPGIASGGPAGTPGGFAANGGDYYPDTNLPRPCGVPVTSQIPLLTNAQYDRTLRDLLGITKLTAFDGLAPSALLAPDGDGQLTEAAWSAYMKVAEAASAQVLADPALRGHFIACTPTGDGTECLRETIVRFGRRAFRRPLTDAEVARFQKILEQRAQITATGTVDEIAEVLLQTFLVSPSFLQRAETSEILSERRDPEDGRPFFALSSTELAARLSYTFWGSMPDEALDQAADANALLTSDQLWDQATRMLRDEKARDLVAAFHRFYLGLDPLRAQIAVNRDPALFPGFDSAVLAAANDEVDKFFDAIVFEQKGSIKDLFTSPLGFVNARTAPFYGLDPAQFGSELRQVELDARQRPGFLTRLAFLATYAYPARTAPILRGAFIQRNIVGLPLPPPTVECANAPLPQGSQFHTNRERVDAQTSGVPCARCHETYLDPPGFVLESYDAVGAWQTVEADTGAPIETAADVRFDDTKIVHIEDASELMKKLSELAEVGRTYRRRWVSYAFGRSPNRSDECVADQLYSDDIQTLFVWLTRADSFSNRKRGTP
ncbi:MAG TPA: DUF1592 domain-containing protein [Polyangiaceae bacterium]|nr:DUF1592 domain-containing protein [Polyangiaceae bacterium]